MFCQTPLHDETFPISLGPFDHHCIQVGLTERKEHDIIHIKLSIHQSEEENENQTEMTLAIDSLSCTALSQPETFQPSNLQAKNQMAVILYSRPTIIEGTKYKQWTTKMWAMEEGQNHRQESEK